MVLRCLFKRDDLESIQQHRDYASHEEFNLGFDTEPAAPYVL